MQILFYALTCEFPYSLGSKQHFRGSHFLFALQLGWFIPVLPSTVRKCAQEFIFEILVTNYYSILSHVT